MDTDPWDTPPLNHKPACISLLSNHKTNQNKLPKYTKTQH